MTRRWERCAMGERILVVGRAVLTCLGHDIETMWEGLIAGRSGLKRQASLSPKRYKQQIAGMVEDFGPGTAFQDPALEKIP